MKKQSLFLLVVILSIILLGCSEATNSPNTSSSSNNPIVNSSSPASSTIPTAALSPSNQPDYVTPVPTELPAAIKVKYQLSWMMSKIRDIRLAKDVNRLNKQRLKKPVTLPFQLKTLCPG